jgi:BTB/POZ domain-containing protein KCTD9
MHRLPFRESCLRIGRLNYKGEPPSIPERMPTAYDGEPLGVRIFRELVEQADYSNLTLPRTFFGRSEINTVSFRNTDLSQSNLCWNDFIDVDFAEANLAEGDLRSSVFERVKFDGADLRGADLRHSWFGACAFDGAAMQGTILTHTQRAQLTLSETQAEAVDWRVDAGPEPDGG